jgi:hypothetical protein
VLDDSTCNDTNEFYLKQLVLSPISRNTARTIEARYNYAVNFSILKNTHQDEKFYFYEVGFSLSTRRRRGRSLVGTDAIKQVTCIRSRNLSICVAMNVGGEYFKVTSTTPYNSRLFCEFIASFIRNLSLKGIIKGVIVLDNVKFNHCTEVIDLLNRTGFVVSSAVFSFP